MRIDWRAVEHDPKLALIGTHSAAARSSWETELAEVATPALPGEDVPATPPTLTSNTHAAVAAYAEAVIDGIAGELRRCLFTEIWVQGRHLSSAAEMRRLVTGLMWQPEDMASAGQPGYSRPAGPDPDLRCLVRRSGGTIAGDGEPLTTAGWRRIRQWREDWLVLPSQVIPAVIRPDGVLRSGTDGLRYLAGLVGQAGTASFRRPQPASRSANGQSTPGGVTTQRRMPEAAVNAPWD